jgi:GNAT superfamily N-acetyltransferase
VPCGRSSCTGVVVDGSVVEVVGTVVVGAVVVVDVLLVVVEVVAGTVVVVVVPPPPPPQVDSAAPPTAKTPRTPRSCLARRDHIDEPPLSAARRKRTRGSASWREVPRRFVSSTLPDTGAGATRGRLDRVTLSIVSGQQWPADLERLLRELPEWFGIESSIQQYVEDSKTLPTTAALDNDRVIGVCVVRFHTPVAAEIEVLAVERSRHRSGIGRRLLEHVETELRERGIALLQVKTRGPSAPSDEYERTRAFYASLGYLPLEERTDIWGPENPCLICVKPLT